MPLAFETIGHGRVAFGFFNIESDMLLLEHSFFFADRFCEMIVQTAKIGWTEPFEVPVDAYEIAGSDCIGDLMGAIQGVNLHGFMGRLYAKFPFPRAPDDFKQNPAGFLTRGIVRDIISPFARKTELTFATGENFHRVNIGPFVFDRQSFQQLIYYVEQGGYPRWRSGVAPPYVIWMKKAVEESLHPLFEEMVFEAG